MGDAGDHIVRLLDHPLVAPGDSEAGMDSFDALQEQSIGVVVGVFLSGHTLKHNGISDVYCFENEEASNFTFRSGGC